jgi:hypothetical protein
MWELGSRGHIMSSKKAKRQHKGDREGGSRRSNPMAFARRSASWVAVIFAVALIVWILGLLF